MQILTAADTSRHMYDKDNEPHVRAIDRLVNELGISAEEVNKSYREVLEELNKDIKIKAFLPILVSRVVRQRLSRHN
jgi:transcription initiation factor TFIIIB Brf1 subunit/transcription initiation factor TFIIB